MFRWHYVEDGELPDTEKAKFLGGPLCIVKTSEYSDGLEVARYGFSQGLECFMTIERPEPISDIAVAWCYLEDVFDALQTVSDRMTGIISDTEAVFRKYLNDSQTDSVTGAVEMKTGELRYETQNSKEKDEENYQ